MEIQFNKLSKEAQYQFFATDPKINKNNGIGGIVETEFKHKGMDLIGRVYLPHLTESPDIEAKIIKQWESYNPQYSKVYVKINDDAIKCECVECGVIYNYGDNGYHEDVCASCSANDGQIETH